MRKLCMVLLCLNLLINALAKEKYPYQDSDLPVKVRVEDLLARMTIDEKIGQLRQCDLSRELVNGRFKEGAMIRIFGANGAGTIASPFIYTQDVARVYNEAQRYLVEETRLGIPGLLIAETLHGHLAVGSTVFPQSIGLGATWNPDLVNRMGQAIALEASSVGVKQALAPVLDLSRDQRFGRVEECYGEDPYLVSKMGVAYITGMQGENVTKIGSENVMCMAKHFAAYSVPNGGINLGPASVGERELRSLHLPPFEAAVKEAGVCAIMPSYNEIDGVAAHKNRFLLYDVLRKEWGFDGFVFSDYEGIAMLKYFQKVAESKKIAALQSIQAGVDLEAPSDECYMYLKELVADGELDEAVVDQAVRRVLATKFKSGLFEKPYVNVKRVKSIINKKEHIQLAREIAEESVVLLKNQQNILPLTGNDFTISICGPNADQVQFGDYSYSKRNEDGVTVLEGLYNHFNKDRVIYSKGCDLTNLDKSGFREAVNNASKSDVAIVVVGGTSATLSGIGWGGGTNDINTCGEGFDRASLGLPGVQLDLVKEIHKTGKPVIVVMINGRGYSIPWMKENVNAIIEAWYPGEQGGEAIARIIRGEVNPSGKLSVSFPQSAGHNCSNYNYKPSGHGYYHKPGTPENPGRDYVFSTPKPLFPFGFGLSYTQFELSNLKINKSVYSESDIIQVELRVKNVGDRTGKEVVQLYVNDLVSSVTTPVKELKGFKKIMLAKGEEKVVTFNLAVKDLALIDLDMNKVVEAGEFELMIGNSSDNIRLRKKIRVE
ncbi:MAG: glycoside hydrolase family 3 C-terminal domain-containing protein [Carboxylicivirga sp.]|nr:glycoside hydrolase family 3 C-terminal domain-containing protein [Carboxylicivirga sp.]MCT4646284.1 glycoside hydrolase family 3 C-terminal domain-containing protein [Carboxylicivirga sp.]